MGGTGRRRAAGLSPPPWAGRIAAAGFSLRLSRARHVIPALLPVILFSIVSSASDALGRRPQDLIPVKELIVPGDAGWVDTGIDVEEDQEYFFRGEGEISLQKGNPEAACGPEGADIQGLQQPLPERNLGCLAGKVAQVLAVRTDEKTGQEIRDELVRYFFIGREAAVAMPIKGRLFVGVNENVVRDNDGEFRVAIFRLAP
jgi:hypothetical protein